MNHSSRPLAHSTISSARTNFSRGRPWGSPAAIPAASIRPQPSPGDVTGRGVVGVCEALRLELRGTGVEVACVMPATVKTDLASGVTPRGIAVEPEVVGRAVRRAIERPLFELFVPWRAGLANRAI